MKNNKTFLFGLIAIIFVLAVSVQSALAYFTTYVTAKGGYDITLGYESEIEEKVENKQKIVTLKNTGNQVEYVRVRIFTPENLPNGVTYSVIPTEGWSQNGDYWYYSKPLEPGEETSTIIAKFELPSDDYKESFNIIVVQECTPVKLDINGNQYADWDNVEETNTDIGTTGGNS